MKIIGITGSSGSGKTTVSQLLKEKYDAELINADEVAKELSSGKTMYVKSILNDFGTQIMTKAGKINRKKLAKIIFEDDEKREKLNRLTFIYVVDEIKSRISAVHHKSMILLDAPLLYESGLDQICDIVIGVISQKEEKINRLKKRDHLSQEEAQKRLQAQITNEMIEENADYVIRNNGDLEQLQKQLERMNLETKE